MAKAKKQMMKKTLRKQIFKTLEEVFNDFEDQLGKRRFRKAIKKATKVLSADIKLPKSTVAATPQVEQQPVKQMDMEPVSDHNVSQHTLTD